MLASTAVLHTRQYAKSEVECVVLHVKYNWQNSTEVKQGPVLSTAVSRPQHVIDPHLYLVWLIDGIGVSYAQFSVRVPRAFLHVPLTQEGKENVSSLLGMKKQP
jgi:hypothetical protein